MERYKIYVDGKFYDSSKSEERAKYYARMISIDVFKGSTIDVRDVGVIAVYRNGSILPKE